LTQLCPYPPLSGSAIKTYNILKHLSLRHEINLLTFIRGEGEIRFISHLSKYCRQVDFCTIKRSKGLNLIHAAKSLLAAESFIITRDYHPRMRAKTLDLLKDKPDLIYADHLQMFQFVPRPAPCPVLLDDHNVEWRIIERFASTGASRVQRLFAALEWGKLRAYELDACRRAALVLTVTPQDKDVLVSNGISAEKVFPLPVGVDTDWLKPIQLAAESKKVLMLGTMSWPPNADAVTYFVKAIYPLIKGEIPEVRFAVVGANPPRAIRALGRLDSSIEIAGYVEDIRAAVESIGVFVVPLRIGSGMRVKILDAMALGLPIVTTSIGCEGILLTPGEHALVADNPAEFANAVVRLLRNYDERVRLGSAGRGLVEKLYSWPSILDRLDRILSYSLSVFPLSDGIPPEAGRVES